MKSIKLNDKYNLFDASLVFNDFQSKNLLTIGKTISSQLTLKSEFNNRIQARVWQFCSAFCWKNMKLKCSKCEKQPDFFYEVLAWQVNRVSPDGEFEDIKDNEVMEYLCPNCNNQAEEIWD